MSRFWYLLRCPAASPPYNMALDEALWRTAACRARPLLRLYSWDRPAVTFGYFQKFPEHLGAEDAVIRRPTGGGIVYHGDDVDTTYTVVAPPGHSLHALPTQESYNLLHRAVAAALAQKSRLANLPAIPRGGYECFQNPVPGDVVTEDGSKLAGGAQRRGRNGLLHQGSIAARVNPEQLIQGFCQVFDAEFAEYALTAEEAALAERLTVEKYATRTWNRRIA